MDGPLYVEDIVGELVWAVSADGYQQIIAGGIIMDAQPHPETVALLGRYDRAVRDSFVRRWGRDPGDHDPVVWDPLAATPTPIQPAAAGRLAVLEREVEDPEVVREVRDLIETAAELDEILNTPTGRHLVVDPDCEEARWATSQVGFCALTDTCTDSEADAWFDEAALYGKIAEDGGPGREARKLTELIDETSTNASRWMADGRWRRAVGHISNQLRRIDSARQIRLAEAVIGALGDDLFDDERYTDQLGQLFGTSAHGRFIYHEYAEEVELRATEGVGTLDGTMAVAAVGLGMMAALRNHDPERYAQTLADCLTKAEELLAIDSQVG